MANVSVFVYKCRLCSCIVCTEQEMSSAHAADGGVNLCQKCRHYEALHGLVESHSVSISGNAAPPTDAGRTSSVNESMASVRPGISAQSSGNAGDGTVPQWGGTNQNVGSQHDLDLGHIGGANQVVTPITSRRGAPSFMRGVGTSAGLDSRATTDSAFTSLLPSAQRNLFQGSSAAALERNRGQQWQSPMDFASGASASTNRGSRGLANIWSTNQPQTVAPPIIGGSGWGNGSGIMGNMLPRFGNQPATNKPFSMRTPGPQQSRRRQLPVIRPTAMFQVFLFRFPDGNKLPNDEDGYRGRETRLMLDMGFVQTLFFGIDSQAGIQEVLFAAFPVLQETGWQVVSRHSGIERRQKRGEDLHTTEMTDGWRLEDLKTVSENKVPNKWLFIAPKASTIQIPPEMARRFAQKEHCSVEEILAVRSRQQTLTELMPHGVPTGTKRSVDSEWDSPLRGTGTRAPSHQFVVISSDEEDETEIDVPARRAPTTGRREQLDDDDDEAGPSVPQARPDGVEALNDARIKSVRNEDLPKRHPSDTRSDQQVRRNLTAAVLGEAQPEPSELTIRCPSGDADIGEFVAFHKTYGSFLRMRRPFRVKINEFGRLLYREHSTVPVILEAYRYADMKKFQPHTILFSASDLGGPSREFFTDLCAKFYEVKIAEWDNAALWETNSGITLPAARIVTATNTQDILEAFGGAIWTGIFHGFGFPVWVWPGFMRWMVGVPWTRTDIYEWNPTVGVVVDSVLAAKNGVLSAEAEDMLDAWIAVNEGFPRDLKLLPPDILAEKIVDYELIYKHIDVFGAIKKGFMKGPTETVIAMHRADWITLEQMLYCRVQTAAELLEQFSTGQLTAYGRQVFEWIEEIVAAEWNVQQRQKFLRMMTGADFIPVLRQIRFDIIETSDRNYVPVVNTCFSLLKVGSAYENKANFVEALSYAMANFESQGHSRFQLI